MAQQIQQSRRQDAETAWLSALVATMETVSRAECGRISRDVSASVHKQLRGASMAHESYGSVFSFRN